MENLNLEQKAKLHWYKETTNGRRNPLLVSRRQFRPFNRARKFVRSLKFKSIADYHQAYKNRKIPTDIPHRADNYYKEWKSWTDFLGNGNIATKLRKHEMFTLSEARNAVKKYKIKNLQAYEYFRLNHKLGYKLPFQPSKFYGLKDFDQFMQRKKYVIVSLAKAKLIVRRLGIKTNRQYVSMYRTNKLPKTLPANPSIFYGVKH